MDPMRAEKVENLVRAVLATEDDEILCSEFSSRLPAYVDRELKSGDAAASMPVIARHLVQCPECNDLFLAVIQASRPATSST